MYARILVPFDGSPTAERGLIEAVNVAAAMKSRVVVLIVSTGLVGAMEMASVRSYDEAAAQMLAECTALADGAVARAIEVGVQCERAVVDSRTRSVAQVILEEAAARKCDLIVMGTHGRKGVSRLVLGSDAEAVIRGARVPVMLVRLPGRS
jgi:nucleotide-binding universal stress UspA family protein